jgi:hypothetical protein
MADRRFNRAVKERLEHLELNWGSDDDPTEGDAIEDLIADCGMDASGHCSKAGSEECDWECPFSE